MKKLILFLSFPFLLSNINAQSEAQENENYRAFDFWLGEWVVYKTGTSDTLGFSTIETIIDSFAIQETYQNARSKYRGTSINKYNGATGQWEQYWIDNTGLTLYLKGQRIENQMILQNMIDTGDGNIGNRITWTDHSDGSVQQVWEQSYDEGESWSKQFDGTYIKKGTELKKEKGKKGKAKKNKN